MDISVRDLRKSFHREGQAPLLVLDGVDLYIEHGEFVTLLGPTGCGKTTLLKIIAGIEKADAGEIHPDPSRSKGSLPIIWQEHRLLPWRTVLENIEFPLELKNVESATAENKVRSLLRLMGLEEFHNYYPWQLSGGMEQRVSIARALATDPICLLMDEPFASVDYQTQQRLFKEVQELHKRREITILYVTHDIRDAIKISDRIVILSKRPARVREIIQPTSADLPHSELEQRIWQLLE